MRESHPSTNTQLRTSSTPGIPRIFNDLLSSHQGCKTQQPQTGDRQLGKFSLQPKPM